MDERLYGGKTLDELYAETMKVETGKWYPIGNVTQELIRRIMELEDGVEFRDNMLQKIADILIEGGEELQKCGVRNGSDNGKTTSTKR